MGELPTAFLHKMLDVILCRKGGIVCVHEQVHKSAGGCSNLQWRPAPPMAFPPRNVAAKKKVLGFRVFGLQHFGFFGCSISEY